MVCTPHIRYPYHIAWRRCAIQLVAGRLATRNAVRLDRGSMGADPKSFAEPHLLKLFVDELRTRGALVWGRTGKQSVRVCTYS